MTTYTPVIDGQWVAPVRTRHRMACCDCGLVHTLEFRLIPWRNGGKRIVFRAWRDNRATAARRRAK